MMKSLALAALLLAALLAIPAAAQTVTTASDLAEQPCGEIQRLGAEEAPALETLLDAPQPEARAMTAACDAYQGTSCGQGRSTIRCQWNQNEPGICVCDSGTWACF